MNDISEHGNAAKNGSEGFKHLEALDILPLPICRRSGQIVDVEHATNSEFSAWLIWNGIPFTGSNEWSFDSKCAVINHALKAGLKPRLIALPKSYFGIILELFQYPETE